ncbi:glycosyltransferase family 2 protein [Streptomyces sp. NPDC001922]|uniref:glycosyltransferase family 2 protein n=1 Tax=Streptomyces sp. NPDC001922 TaxID=3364624 RepID=UPI0036B6B1DB
MPVPDVSIIIGAYNAMPYLTQCVTSVVEQSIGHDRMEIIAVDDGSTDGTGAELDRLAAEHPGLIRVVHQENSGGPSAPRNLALDQYARGRYVFFLDADDYLGTEALERLVEAAETNGTDVVLGRMVGVGGRRAPSTMFHRNQPRTDVFASRVYWTLNPMKLFRRDLLERHGLRFPTEYKIGEDVYFTALAYLHASGISVVADYDCLYWVARADGGNITVTHHDTDMRIRSLDTMVDLLDEHVPPGPGRDHLLHRHLTVELRDAVLHIHHEPRRDDQEKALTRLRDVLGRCYHPELAARLPALARLRCHLVEHGMLDELLELVEFEMAQGSTSYGITVRERTAGTSAPGVLVEQGRVLARYPFFRDPERAVPDACYDITDEAKARHRVEAAVLTGSELRLTGHARLRRVPTTTEGLRTELVLRERGTGAEHRLPAERTPTPGLGADEDAGAYDYSRAGFAATVDLATAADGTALPDGLWDLHLAISVDGFTKEIRLGSRRTEAVPHQPATHLVATADGAAPVTLYSTKPHGNLTLDVGEQKHQVAPLLGAGNAAWSTEDGILTVSGTCELAGLPEGTLRVRLTETTGTTGTTEEIVVPVPAPGDDPAAPLFPEGRFAVAVPLTRLSAGDWSVSLHLGTGPGRSWELPVPAEPTLPAARWRRGILPRYAKPVPRTETLTLRVDRVKPLKALLARLGR